MAAVGDTRVRIMSNNHETKTTTVTELNVAKRLGAALKAISPPTVSGHGLLRELLSSNTHLAMAIGGHRGMGENLLNDHDELNMPNLWRENTIASFLKAQQHGAGFVEMDVQITKDGVPVIWHDNELAFGPPSAPITCQVRDLTYDEFCSLGPQVSKETGRVRELISLNRKFRSRKLVGRENPETKLTSWHCFDEDSLPSLYQILSSLPDSLAVNLEVKMTTPNTLLQTPHEEILRATKPIVDCLIQFLQSGSTRKVLLSSFDPDVCIELKKQLADAQLSIPVMFISTGGSCFHVDPRRMSIAAAIEVCLENEVGGFVVDTSVLRMEKESLEIAKKHKLVVATYGLENDDVDWLIEQWKLGVHGAIVDDVASVVPQYIQTVQKQGVQTNNNNKGSSVERNIL